MASLFVNDLTTLDASLLHPRRGLLGASWRVDIELDGTLDHQGMVLDFGLVKRQVKRCIDDHFDHRLLVPTRHDGCRIEPHGRGLRLRFDTDAGESIEQLSPDDALAPLDLDEITPTGLADAIVGRLRPQLPDNIDRITLRLREETIDGAHYRYSHGLKHHAGNCQRIAHGHRSRLRIDRNGRRDEALEQAWAGRWRDIYIATRGDLLERFDLGGVDYCRFGYTAEQGRFELSLPAHRCELIDDDSTVENLAGFIATTLAAQYPGETIRVEAYEGIGKGAVATRPDDRLHPA